MSFLTKTNVQTALAAWYLPTHLVISERNDPDLQRVEPVWDHMRAFSYQRAAVATSNSTGVLEKMQRFCGEDHLKLLPNPIQLPRTVSEAAVQEPRFVIVARLVEQKAIDVLLDAFKLVLNDISGWRLDIVGGGPLRNELACLASELGIVESVTFYGHVTSPIDHLRRSRVFVLPSRFEGMPNALLEAMACGLPAIVSDASPGPLEVISHETSGLVVPVEDASALAEAMLRLARDEVLRAKLGAGAKSYVETHGWAETEPVWRDALQLPDVSVDRV